MSESGKALKYLIERDEARRTRAIQANEIKKLRAENARLREAYNEATNSDDRDAQVMQKNRRIKRLEEAARPFADYIEKMRAWDGVCALPERPTNEQEQALLYALRGE